MHLHCQVHAQCKGLQASIYHVQLVSVVKSVAQLGVGSAAVSCKAKDMCSTLYVNI